MTREQRQPPTTTCEAMRADGSPCTVAPLRSGAYCFAHSPDLADRRAAARVKGGHNRSNLARGARAAVASPPVATLIDRLTRALDDTLAGDLDARQANAAANVARALLAALEAGDVEARFAELERLVELRGLA